MIVVRDINGRWRPLPPPPPLWWRQRPWWWTWQHLMIAHSQLLPTKGWITISDSCPYRRTQDGGTRPTVTSQWSFDFPSSTIVVNQQLPPDFFSYYSTSTFYLSFGNPSSFSCWDTVENHLWRKNRKLRFVPFLYSTNTFNQFSRTSSFGDSDISVIFSRMIVDIREYDMLRPEGKKLDQQKI